MWPVGPLGPLGPLGPSGPLVPSYEVAAPGALHLVNDFGGVWVPLQMMPHLYNTPRQKRKCDLERSLFDLVDAYTFLALTDSKLLGWFLGLSPGDRMIIQDEGGFHNFLKRHPTLEVSSHHVYVKCKSTMTTNSSLTQEQDLRMLTGYVQENLTTLDSTNASNGSESQPCEEVRHHRVVVDLENSFQTAYSSSMTQEQKNDNKQMANSSGNMLLYQNPGSLVSFSLDTELERYRQNGTSERRIQGSEWTNIKNDTSCIESAELKLLTCPLAPENSKKKQGQNCVAYDTKDIVMMDENEAYVGLDETSRDIHSLMEEDMSILVCMGSDGQKTCSGPVTANDKTLALSSEVMEDVQSVSKRYTAEKGTSLMNCTSTCDVMVGTELAQYASAFTQTDDPKSRDQHVNTEVCMSDLDYVAVEFFKLKKAQEEMKLKSSGCKLENKCECFQRAQQAELSLLALQYSMCRQHCWSLYCSTAVGDHVNPLGSDMNQDWPEEHAANILGALKKLQYDFIELRNKLLEGIPLNQLRPLSVDCEKITSASYIPAQIIATMPRSVLSRHPQEPQKDGKLDDKYGSVIDCQKKVKRVIPEIIKAKRAVTLVPKGTCAVRNVQTLLEYQTTSCKDPTTGETWYDAEEDLETRQNQDDLTSGSAVEDAKTLTSNETQRDVAPSSEKYHGSKISVLSGPQPAEVGESDGFSLQSHNLHVEFMNRAVCGGQSQTPNPNGGLSPHKMPANNKSQGTTTAVMRKSKGNLRTPTL